ncbi:MAG: hypothetical protein GF398_00595 [Chitinivibrionales bacterium]|nr:hypothetical protein [Chitinivibrionales bacterium]
MPVRSPMWSKKALLIIAIFCSAIISRTHATNATFHTANLDYIPAYEKYIFEGRGSTVKEMPVVIEYETAQTGNGKSKWLISGKMKFRETLIEEHYQINHRNLKITSFTRKQSFDRGEVNSTSTYEVDVSTNDPEEFIVGTIQGLMYILRTFPFESENKKVLVRAPQQQKGHLNLRIHNKGKKTISTRYFGAVEVHHLEVSLVFPLIGGILPKLNYYFRDDPQKTLVAMEGLLPATGKRLDVELTEYEMRRD